MTTTRNEMRRDPEHMITVSRLQTKCYQGNGSMHRFVAPLRTPACAKKLGNKKIGERREGRDGGHFVGLGCHKKKWERCRPEIRNQNGQIIPVFRGMSTLKRQVNQTLEPSRGWCLLFLRDGEEMPIPTRSPGRGAGWGRARPWGACPPPPGEMAMERAHAWPRRSTWGSRPGRCSSGGGIYGRIYGGILAKKPFLDVYPWGGRGPVLLSCKIHSQGGVQNPRTKLI